MGMRAVFLDRDGVINKAFTVNGKPFPPYKLSEFIYLPGVVEIIARLRNSGLLVIVFTNQPDISKGLVSAGFVQSLHEKLRRDTGVDDIYVCHHLDEDKCECRKPKAGMLRKAAERWDISLHESFVVGDRWRDIAAGKAVGCRTYFIDYSYKEERKELPHEVVSSLQQAGEKILREIADKEENLNA